nr:DUF1285 domain-containing protein [Euryhalocaulis caribicus]
MSDKSRRENDDSFTRLLAAARQKAAPVEMWEPEHCGKIDIEIRRDGSWWHEGGRITRLPLVKLFASVLRKDEDGKHYLVTPVEKMEIRVEAAPFLAVEMDRAGEGRDQILQFRTAVGDRVTAGPDHPIRVEIDPETGEPTPFVHVRGRLEALINRPVFYQLAELAEARDGRMGVMSGGEFFDLGPAA